VSPFAQNYITLGSFYVTPPKYYVASPLDPLLAEKLTFLPPRLTPWLPTTKIRFPLTDCVASMSALRRLVSAFFWTSFYFLSAWYFLEVPSLRFSLLVCCKISLIDFPPKNFSLWKIDFLNLFVCFPNDPQAPSYIFLLDNQQPRLKHNQRLRPF